MESNKNNSTTLTQRRIASAKGLHVVCSIVAMLLNIIALVVLLINVKLSEIAFIAFPLALAVLDIVFFVKVIFSNYRFKYAVNGAIIHSVVVLLVSVAAYVVMGMLESKNGIVFVNIAMYAMLIVHVLQSIATLTTALYATKSKKSASKIFGVLFTVIFLVGAGIYGRILLVDGFFGQGGYTDYRTVVYKYDAKTQTYTAIDVLDGYGTNVVIPHQFNGSHVSYIDCALFAHEELTSVKVDCDHKSDCDHNLGFVGISNLNFVNPELQLFAPKKYMDSFRKALYTLSLDNKNTYALELANNIYPDDVKENEVYISFGYDSDTLTLVGVENIIPVWVKEKGAEFNIREHTNVDYVKNSDAANPVQLYWCHENQQEKIFKCVVDADGNAISGQINESIVNATVVFEKLYHVEIMADNEDPAKTPIRDIHKYMWQDDELVCEYIITTAGNMQSKLDALPERNGFTLTLKTGTDASKHTITDLANEIELLDASGANTIRIYPEWTLLPPTINSVTADGKSEGHTAIYFDDVKLESTATSPDASISLKYEWLYNNEVIATSSSHTLKNIFPNSETFSDSFNKAGTYTLRVTAGNDATTSCSSVAEKTVVVGFEKREINFVWTMPQNTVYSATNKEIISEYDQNDVVNNDVISYKIYMVTETGNKEITNSNPVKNAAVYDLKVELYGEAAELYAINKDDETETLEITPYPVNVSWGTTEFIYDGEEHNPTASAIGLGNDVIEIDVLGAMKNYNVEGYEATATTANTNYTLGNTTIKFRILKRYISISGWDADSFVYNSKSQHSIVASVNNLAGNQTLSDIANDIEYKGAQTNVGTYEVSVSLPAVYNYAFEGEVIHTYDITPLPLTITISNKETVYNGHYYTNFAFTPIGIAENDKIDEILALTYTGEAVNAIDVGEYTISAQPIGAEKYYNYDISITDGELTIKKKALTVTITSVVKTYNGLPFTAADASFTLDGLADTDTKADVLDLDYTGNAIGAVNYNTIAYKIEADYVPGVKFDNYDVVLKTGTLTMKKAPLTITAVGGTKEYDGMSADRSEFSFIAEGLVNGETPDMLGTPTYSGMAVTQSYAATHQLSVVVPPNNDVTSNYEIKYVPGEYIITKKALTVTIVSGLNKIYDGYAPSNSLFDFTVDGLIPTETKANLGTATYVGTATENSNAGTYDLTITALSGGNYTRNYDINYVPGKFTITPRSITVSIVNKNNPYTANTHSFDYNNYTIDDLATPDNISMFTPSFGGTAIHAVNVGTYTLSVQLSNMDNYYVTYENGTYEITKRALTLTVNDSSMTYTGLTASTSSFSVVPAGLQGTDSLNDLGSIVFGGAAKEAVNAGAYDITVSIENPTSKFNNYEIVSNTPGTLSIKRASLTITADNKSKTYDGKYDTPVFTFTPNGFVNGEKEATLGKIGYTGTANNAKNAGEYTITPYWETKNEVACNNYEITFESGTYKINSKALTVNVSDKSHTYDGNKFTGFGITTSGLISGEDESVLGTVTYTTYVNNVPTDAINAGGYEIRATVSAGTNYDITFNYGTLTISQKNVKITPVASNKTYDGKVNTFSVTAEGLVAGHSPEQLGDIKFTGDANKINANKEGEVYVVGVSIENLTTIGKNYIIDCNATAEFTIAKRDITITASATEKVYNGKSDDNASYFRIDVTAGEFASGEDADTFGFEFSGDAVGAVAAREAAYELKVALKKSAEDNYNITYVYGEFKISPMKITVRPTAVRENNTTTFDYMIENVTDATIVNAIKAELGEFTVNDEAKNASAAGVYEVTIKFNTANENYEITFNKGELVITASTPTPENTTGTTTPVVPAE